MQINFPIFKWKDDESIHFGVGWLIDAHRIDDAGHCQIYK